MASFAGYVPSIVLINLVIQGNYTFFFFFFFFFKFFLLKNDRFKA